MNRSLAKVSSDGLITKLRASLVVDLLVSRPENSNFMDVETRKNLQRHIERTGRYEPLNRVIWRSTKGPHVKQLRLNEFRATSIL